MIREAFIKILLIVFLFLSFSINAFQIEKKKNFKELSEEFIFLVEGYNVNMDKARETVNIIIKDFEHPNKGYENTEENLYYLTKLIEHSYYAGFEEEYEFLMENFYKNSKNMNDRFLGYYYIYKAYFLEEREQNMHIDEKLKKIQKNYNKAIKYGMKDKDDIVLFDVYSSMAKNRIYEQNYYEAQKLLNTSKKYISRKEDEVFFALARVEFYYYLNMYEESLSTANKIISYTEKLKDNEINPAYRKYYLLTLYSMKSLNESKLKKFDAAEKTIKKALKLVTEANDKYEINYHIGFYAYILISNDKIEEVEKYMGIFEKEKEYYESYQTIYYNAQIVKHLYYKKIGDYEKSLKEIKLLEESVLKNEPMFMHRLYVYISEIEYLLKNEKEALKYRKKYIEHLEKDNKEKSIKIATIYDQKQESEYQKRINKDLSNGIENKKRKLKSIEKRKNNIDNLTKQNILISSLLLFLALLIFMFYVKYNKISNKDGLTKLFNRRYIKKYYSRKIKKNKGISFILFDLDYFKIVNDTYGHDIGDKVIIEVSKIMKEVTRKTDVLSRIGGEEFLILTKNNPKIAFKMAERLRKKIESHDFSHIVKDLKMTASFGVSNNKKVKTIDEMYNFSDQALYEAKNAGRNKVIYKRAK